MEKFKCADCIFSNMGRIDVLLSDELEREFREEVYKQKGMKKGNIKKAIEEAIKLWIETNKKKRSAAAKKAWKTRKRKLPKSNIKKR